MVPPASHGVVSASLAGQWPVASRWSEGMQRLQRLQRTHMGLLRTLHTLRTQEGGVRKHSLTQCRGTAPTGRGTDINAAVRYLSRTFAYRSGTLSYRNRFLMRDSERVVKHPWTEFPNHLDFLAFHRVE